MADVAALRVASLSVRFGGVPALVAVTLEIPAGRALGVIGPNGAGKTTLLNAVSGFVRPAEGRIWLRETDITALGADRRAVAGIGRTFQTPRLFPKMTVLDNLQVAARQRRRRRVRQGGELSGLEGLTPTEALDLVGLGQLGAARTERLAAGDRRFAELARGLMLAPTVLLLDEPATGLRDSEIAVLGKSVNRLVQEYGLAVLLISHDMRVIDDCCSTVVVLDRGAVLAQGRPGEIRQDRRVIDAYFGTGATS